MKQPEFELVAWLRHLRTANNQTQAEQAELCGVQPSYLSRVENRKVLFHAQVQAAVIKLYKLEGEQLERFDAACSLHNNAKDIAFNEGFFTGLAAMKAWVRGSYNEREVLNVYSPGIADAYREIVGKTVLQPMQECIEHFHKRKEG